MNFKYYASNNKLVEDSTENIKNELYNRIDHIANSFQGSEEDKQNIVQEMNSFKTLFNQFLIQKKLESEGNFLNWDKIQSLSPTMIKKYNTLPEINNTNIIELLNKLVVLKLNGGLGTTMGCKGAKSVIEVRDNKSFLDLIVEQLNNINTTYGTSVPLLLMNSFNTDKQTEKIVHRYQGSSVPIFTFTQSRFPRIRKEGFMPISESYTDKDIAWYPPGHGDVFEALDRCGLLNYLLSQGKEYIFISNVDNLGASVDLSILQYLESSCSEYIMELTNKTIADIKGGTLIDYDGVARLLEIAQVPSEHIEEFKSIKKFKIFNTNNLWINLKAIRRLLTQNAFSGMEVIVNPKVIDNTTVLQLERAAGSAIRFFNNSHGVVVPRSRFLPVKSTSDLLLIQSNLYSLINAFPSLSLSRPFGTIPVINLGNYFKSISEYEKRFRKIPDILELDHLTISGDVYFGENVTLKGTVVIVAPQNSRIDIPSGSILENKVISGSLTILDH